MKVYNNTYFLRVSWGLSKVTWYGTKLTLGIPWLPLPCLPLPSLASMCSHLSPPGLTQSRLVPCAGCEQSATCHLHFRTAVVTLLPPPNPGSHTFFPKSFPPPRPCHKYPPHGFLGSLLLSRCNFLVKAEIKKCLVTRSAGSDWGMLSLDDL